MRVTPITVLSAAVIAALGLSGCADLNRPPSTPNPVPPPASSIAAPAADPGPLPAPEALTDVLYRLADPAVPGRDKLPLVENATADDAATIDQFAAALRDGGFNPVTFTGTDVRWSDRRPGDALATVTVAPPNPATSSTFTFPMEFAPHDGGWQLTRETADTLLAFGNGGTQPAPAGPTPTR